jgi:hypothetical protein
MPRRRPRWQATPAPRRRTFPRSPVCPSAPRHVDAPLCRGRGRHASQSPTGGRSWPGPVTRPGRPVPVITNLGSSLQAPAQAEVFSMVRTLLSSSFHGGGAEDDLIRLMGWTDRSMLDRYYGADLQVRRAIDAKRRRGDLYWARVEQRARRGGGRGRGDRGGPGGVLHVRSGQPQRKQRGHAGVVAADHYDSPAWGFTGRRDAWGGITVPGGDDGHGHGNGGQGS